MAHPHGSITYVPTAKFWLNRSFPEVLKVHTNHVNSVSYADGLISWGHIPPDNVRAYTKITDKFIPWNSNTYSLDYLVEYWYYVVLPSPIEYAWGGEVSFAYDPMVKKNCLIIATASADTDYYFDLPPAPPTWWRNLP